MLYLVYLSIRFQILIFLYYRSAIYNPLIISIICIIIYNTNNAYLD